MPRLPGKKIAERLKTNAERIKSHLPNHYTLDAKSLNARSFLPGQVFIIILVFLAVILIFSAALFSKTSFFVNFGQRNVYKEQASVAADAGLEFALWKLNTVTSGYVSPPAGEILTFGNPATAEVLVVVSDDVTTKTISATAYIPNRIKPKVKQTVEASAELIPGDNIAVRYALQSGTQGFGLSDTYVIGDLYANGSVTGGVERPAICGNVYATNSYASSAVSLACYTGDGTAATNFSTPSPQSMPITASIFATEVAKATPTDPSTCPCTIDLISNMNKGPLKYSGSVTIQGGQTLKVDGNIFINGDLTINGSPIIKAGDAYTGQTGGGNTGPMIIVAGKITINNTGFGPQIVKNSANQYLYLVSIKDKNLLAGGICMDIYGAVINAALICEYYNNNPVSPAIDSMKDGIINITSLDFTQFTTVTSVAAGGISIGPQAGSYTPTPCYNQTTQQFDSGTSGTAACNIKITFDAGLLTGVTNTSLTANSSWAFKKGSYGALNKPSITPSLVAWWKMDLSGSPGSKGPNGSNPATQSTIIPANLTSPYSGYFTFTNFGFNNDPIPSNAVVQDITVNYGESNQNVLGTVTKSHSFPNGSSISNINSSNFSLKVDYTVTCTLPGHPFCVNGGGQPLSYTPTVTVNYTIPDGYSTVADSSGNGYNLTASGNPSFLAGQSAPFGTAINTASSGNKHAYINDSGTIFTPKQFSITLWFKKDTTANATRFFITKQDLAQTEAQSAYRLLYFSGNTLNFLVNANDSDTGAVVWDWAAQSGTIAEADDLNWHFLAATFDGSKACVAVDGATSAPNYICSGVYNPPDINNPVRNDTNPLRIGNDSLAFDGLIDNVKFYNRALSATELQNIKTTEQNGTP